MTVSDEDITDLLDSEKFARRTKVMFLRNAGATWAAIAAECKVSEATCRNDYKVVCRDINNEDPADIVARHRAVVFDIQRANYPAIMRGDKDAAAVVLRALNYEADLLGIKSPTKIMAGVSAEEFANEAAQLIARITALDPHTMKELTRVHGTPHTVIDADIVDPPDPQPGSDPDPEVRAGADGSRPRHASPFAAADQRADGRDGADNGAEDGHRGGAASPFRPDDAEPDGGDAEATGRGATGPDAAEPAPIDLDGWSNI